MPPIIQSLDTAAPEPSITIITHEPLDHNHSADDDANQTEQAATVTADIGANITASEARKKLSTIISVNECGDGDSTTSDINAAEKLSNCPAKRMTPWQAALQMIALNCSLGVLCLPSTLLTLGTIIATIYIIFYGLLLWYTGYLVWRFKMQHPEANSYSDMVGILWGNTASLLSRPVLAFALTFIMASHIRAFGQFLCDIFDYKLSIELAETVAMLCMMIGNLVWRSAADGMIISVISCLSVFLAVIVGAVGVAHADLLPGEQSIWLPSMATLTALPIAMAIAQSAVMFAFMSHTAFPSIIDEMEQPARFPQALKLANLGTISFAVLVTLLFSVLVGRDVASPALQAAKKPFSTAAYVISIPALMIAPIVCCRVGALGIHDPLWDWCKERQFARKKPRKFENFLMTALLALLWGIAMTIANVLPHFNAIVTLAGAMFAPILCVIFPVALSIRGDGLWTTAYRRLKEQRGLMVGSFYVLLFVYGWFVLAFSLWGTSKSFSVEAHGNQSVALPLTGPLSSNGTVTVNALGPGV